MHEDPTKAMPLDPERPQHGLVGPRDPHADPETHPGLEIPHDLRTHHEHDPETDPNMLPVPAAEDPPTVQVAPEPPTVPVKAGRRSVEHSRPVENSRPVEHGRPVENSRKVAHSRTGGLYAGLILSAIVMIFLLVFILQNLATVPIYFLGFSGSLPIGVAMLLSAIAGLLLIAIPGGVRILQLRRAARRG
jgi:uncharacterized integral membrane protein